MRSRNWVFSLAALALMAIGSQAQALVLGPGDMIEGTGYGPSNCEPGCVETVFETENLTLLYKSDYGYDRETGAEWTDDSGSYADSYSTEFMPTADPTDAVISWIDGMAAISCPECYLAVKDGNADPGYYFYDLSAWDGMETIELLGFWAGDGVRGAISHVAIWGKETVGVPEPGPLALLGIGLVAMTLATRRRRRTIH